ncbi:hypothetical protein [Paenibacillus melissococcoides]|uniref:hypothetical protein n=1 Tax=Paenibacillus melissococcoides TaxID=2912268 RepID=UPI0021C446D9|nr:hypothetical protein [Paenibacillus melissococcoides]CAH8717447.1 hypothetical protein HTL2_004950 [Paenibacillus melissococcoides]
MVNSSSGRSSTASSNPSGDAGSRNELRGTWYPTDIVSRVRIPFLATEANFQNRGLYPVRIGIGSKQHLFGEAAPHYQEIELQPGEVVRQFKLQQPGCDFWIKASKRVSLIYFLLIGA